MQKAEFDLWRSFVAAALNELERAAPESRQKDIALADLSKSLYRAQASIDKTASEIPKAQATRVCRSIQKEIRKHRAKFAAPTTAVLRDLFDQLQRIDGALSPTC